MNPTKRFLAQATEALAQSLAAEKVGANEARERHMGRAQAYFDCARHTSGSLFWPSFGDWLHSCRLRWRRWRRG